MRIRRVVTGHSDGKATVASDEEVEPVEFSLAPGMLFHRFWGGDERPAYPDDGSALDHDTYFPPLDGFRFIAFTVPPATSAEPIEVDDLEAEMAEADQALPGLLAHMELENPGFHTTDTVDMGVVASGSIVLQLDDGEEVVLNAGDTYVQSGTRHAWRNDGDEPATVFVVLVGARRG